jgi:hypothetical protein
MKRSIGAVDDIAGVSELARAPVTTGHQARRNDRSGRFILGEFFVPLVSRMGLMARPSLSRRDKGILAGDEITGSG